MYTQRAVSYLAINMFGGGRKQMDDQCSEKSNQMERPVQGVKYQI